MKQFIKYAGIRAIKTICQTALSLISVGTIMSDVDWKMVASASLLSGILSILTSVVTGLPEIDNVEFGDTE